MGRGLSPSELIVMSQAEGGPFDFTALLAPIAVEHFFRAHWERHPLHVSRLNGADEPIQYGDLVAFLDRESSRLLIARC